MEQSSLRIGIVGALVLFVVFGFSLAHFSSAQTADSSSSATSTVSLEATTSSPLDQSSLSSSYATISTSPDPTTLSTTPDTSTQSSSNSLVSSPSTSTPLLLSSASTTASSTMAQTTPPPAPTGYPICDRSVKNVPGDYPTIQAAINAANIGDTVKIAAGTYNEDLTLTSGVCLEGAGIDQTIISKSGASGITGNNVSYVIIKNLTVKNSGCAPGVCGGGGNGGGIELSQANNITIQSCRLTGNVAVDGGGMAVSQSSVTMDHCLIDHNTAGNVGAGMVMDPGSTAALANVTVANNNWVNPLGNGGIGGISADGSGLQMANSILWGNNSKNFSGNGARVSNSDINGWSGGINNISSNPNFAAVTNYHLQGGSPSAGMGLY
jgi:hypothetical protein